jgi:hypothetical protein
MSSRKGSTKKLDITEPPEMEDEKEKLSAEQAITP